MRCMQRWLKCGIVTEGKKSALNVGIPSIRLAVQMEEVRSSGGQLIQTSSVIPRQVCLLLDTQCQTSTIASYSVSAVCLGCHFPLPMDTQCHLLQDFNVGSNSANFQRALWTSGSEWESEFSDFLNRGDMAFLCAGGHFWTFQVFTMYANTINPLWS